MAPPVSWYLEAVFRKRDEPAYGNDQEKGEVFESQVAIPGSGHEQVGDTEQDHGSHTWMSLLGLMNLVMSAGRTMQHIPVRMTSRPMLDMAFPAAETMASER